MVAAGLLASSVNAQISPGNIGSEGLSGGGSASGPTTFAQSNFSVAANTPIESTLLTPGAFTWSDSSAGGFKADGAGNVFSAALVNLTHATFNLGQSNFTYSCNMSSYNSGTSICALASMIFRYQDANNYWKLELDSRYFRLNLYKNVAGVQTLVMPMGLGIVSGVFWTCRVDCIGQNITVWADGTEIGTWVDSTLDTATIVGIQVGVAGSPGTAAQWNSLVWTTFQGINFNWPVFTPLSTTTPLIPLGTAGTYDDTDINSPNPAYDTFNNRYAMYASVYHDSGSHNNIQNLGAWYSSSIAGPWTASASNPIVTANGNDGAGAFDGTWLDFSNTWIALNTENGTVPGTVGLMTATGNASGTDGPWTRVNYNVLTGTPPAWRAAGMFEPIMRLRNDGILEAWFVGQSSGGTRAFGRMTSTTGLTWTEDPNNPLCTPLGALFNLGLGGIGGVSTFTPSVAVEGQQIMLSFDGIWNPNPGPGTQTRSVSQAISIDGYKTWHFRLNALQAQGSGFMSVQACDQFVWPPLNNIGATILRMFYCGANVAGNELNLNLQIAEADAPWPYSTLLNGD
jgi:hypothetical protein